MVGIVYQVSSVYTKGGAVEIFKDLDMIMAIGQFKRMFMLNDVYVKKKLGPLQLVSELIT